LHDCDKQLAEDCWQAATMLRHPCAMDAETPEWLAAAAGHLRPTALPEVRS